MDHPSDATPEGGNGDVAVAIDTLNADDGTSPAVGDDVDVQVQGKVSRIEGDCAYVTPETCNGKPPPEMSGDNAGSLRDQAQQADAEPGY
jgi:hypothetical protein